MPRHRPIKGRSPTGCTTDILDHLRVLELDARCLTVLAGLGMISPVTTLERMARHTAPSRETRHLPCQGRGGQRFLAGPARMRECSLTVSVNSGHPARTSDSVRLRMFFVFFWRCQYWSRSRVTSRTSMVEERLRSSEGLMPSRHHGSWIALTRTCEGPSLRLAFSFNTMTATMTSCPKGTVRRRRTCG
jgi:hypothetical protein